MGCGKSGGAERPAPEGSAAAGFLLLPLGPPVAPPYQLSAITLQLMILVKLADTKTITKAPKVVRVVLYLLNYHRCCVC